MVSVVVPLYNCGKYISKCIESILKQTYSDFELIVCDDGSTDNSLEIVKSFKDERIVVMFNDKNEGLVFTYNRLFNSAKGDFIMIQDADDWSIESRISDQLEIFETYPDVSICGTNGYFYYNEQRKIPCQSKGSGYVTDIKSQVPFIPASVMFRKEVLKVVPGMHKYFSHATSMDQYFLLDILLNFKGYFLDKHLYYARFNPTSNTRLLNGSLRKLTAHEAFLLLKKQRLETNSDWLIEGKTDELIAFERRLLKDNKFMAEKYRELSVHRIDSGDLTSASAFMVKSFISNPFNLMTFLTALYWLRVFFKFSKPTAS